MVQLRVNKPALLHVWRRGVGALTTVPDKFEANFK